MKTIILSTVIFLTAITGASAMSYQQAREQALFLTDKMAYELNLNEQQYEAAYEINLDYLMDVNTVDDVYSVSWRQRNVDLQHVLLDWQYTAFCAATYFFRPLSWHSGNWHFAIYAHYPHRDFFYFSRPACYVSYRGAHSWRRNGGASWYVHHVHTFRNPGRPHAGLRDNFHGHGFRREAGRPVEAHRSIDNNRRPYGQQHHDTYRNNRPGTPVYNNRNQKDNNFQNRNDRGNYRRESSTRTTVNTHDTGSRVYNRNNQAAPSNNRNAYGRTNSGNSSFRNGNSHTYSSGNRSVSRGSNATTRSASPQSQGSPSSRISRR